MSFMKTRFVILFAAVTLIPALPADAGKIRGHSARGGSRVVVHGHPGYHVSYHYLPPYYGYYGFYSGPFYPGYYPPYPYGRYGTGAAYEVAFVDTDISPEKAEVHLDGEYIGVADDFDGFPRYLAVEPGSHTLSFRAEGYRSVTRRVKLPRGAVLSLDFTLPKAGAEEKGLPEEEIIIPEPEAAEAGEMIDAAGAGGDGAEPGKDEAAPGFVRLKVTPPDASIYIDGEFYGSASMLGRLHGDMRLTSGVHEVEIVRPGYRQVRREIVLHSGDRITVAVDLEREGP